MQFNRKIIAIIGGALVFSYAILLASEKKETPNNQPAHEYSTQYPNVTLLINDYRLTIEIADTPEKKSKGLGGRTQLADDYGMLFPFENQPYLPVFWMKGMKVPIDIIWIKDSTIIDIDKNAQPEPGISDTQLKHYSPNGPVDYVLEVRGGLSDEKGLEVGDSVRFEVLE